MMTLKGLFSSKPSKNEINDVSETPNTPHAKEPLTAKDELVHCNNRLERYITKQQSKDHKIEILQTQINELRQNLADEKDRIHKSVKNAFDQLRDEKNDLAKNMVSLRTQNEKNAIALKSKASEIKAKGEMLRRSEKRLFAMIKKRESDLALLNRLNVLAQRYRSDNEKNSKEVQLLRLESNHVRAERDDLAKALEELRSQKEKRQSDAHFSSKTYHDMVASYEIEIGKLKQKMLNIEESLRTEFSNQMSEALKSRQKAFSSEKRNAVEKLSKVYEEKVAAAHREADEANSALEAAQNRSEKIRSKLKSAREEKKSLSAELLAHKRKVKSLEQHLAAVKAKPIRKQSRNAQVIKHLKEAYRKKEAELEAMAAQKEELFLEIQSYRDILDREEGRLSKLPQFNACVTAGAKETDATPGEPAGLEELRSELEAESRKETKPKPKRRGRKSGGAAKSPRAKRRSLRSRRSSGRTEGTAPVVVEETETEEKNAVDCVFECYGTAERIEVRNKSSDEVNLEGWKLRKVGDENLEEVGFPPSLKKEEVFFVYPSEQSLLEDNSEGHKKVWAAGAFSDEGDIAIANDVGKQMYSFEISSKEDE